MMSDLNTKYNELVIELFNNLIFYLPKVILEVKEVKDYFEANNKTSDYFEKIIITDDKINFNTDKELNFLIILKKTNQLQKNCFKLIEYKTILNELEFNFIIENYTKQVDIYKSISKLLLDYFDVNSPAKDSTTKFLFNSQLACYTNHLAELKKHFDIKIQSLNHETIIQEVKRTLIDKNIETKQDKHFRDFISQKKNKEIEKIILEKFQNEKGKKLRYLIEYLNELGIISMVHGDRTKIYSAMKNSFNWEIGTHQSIFGNWFSIPNKEYTKFKETLNSYFPFLS
jgi:hypothetical protein